MSGITLPEVGSVSRRTLEHRARQSLSKLNIEETPDTLLLAMRETVLRTKLSKYAKTTKLSRLHVGVPKSLVSRAIKSLKKRGIKVTEVTLETSIQRTRDLDHSRLKSGKKCPLLVKDISP